MFVQMVLIAATALLDLRPDLRAPMDNLPWRFQNAKSKKCLDTESDGMVVIKDCNNELSQRWEPYNRLWLRNKSTMKCLQLSQEGQVSTEACDGSRSQNWEIAHTYSGLPLRNLYFLCIGDELQAVECKPGGRLGDNMIWVRTHPRI